jgi:PHP family Zn ribbon phosphoesterase
VKEFRADLHIHTCLSPCAELEMSPRKIVSEAKRKGLQVIGICDHNSAENVPAVERSAAPEGITVIGGMEVTSREEVHVLALFGSEENLFALQEIVHANLHGATDITIERLVDLIHERDGLAIAAHVDREGFGIIGQLGLIPEGLPLDALELADPGRREGIPQRGCLPFITSSDAHKLEDVGRRSTTFWMQAASLAEIRRCLSGAEGRRTRI